MKFILINPVVKKLFVLVFFAVSPISAHADMRNNILINAGKLQNLQNDNSRVIIDQNIALLGMKLFEDEILSLNGKISCSSCHLDKFGSADGIENAIGVGGEGEGNTRKQSDGFVVPRNTLPLWGRGETDFTVFFWDGKVEVIDDLVHSQFGSQRPSENAFEVAIHLPFVEIKEMVLDDYFVESTLKTESVGSAEEIFSTLTARVKADKDYANLFRSALKLEPDEIKFTDIAIAIKKFLQFKFNLRSTKFSNYISGLKQMSNTEIDGGLTFFGKGKCSSCHNGRHFTDFKYHSIPFKQIGFGKNGFGIDYGRYNVTFNPSDLYKFRTPPLTNVAKTAPYGHSGSAKTLKEAIIYHFDPLRLVSPSKMDRVERAEFYKKLVASSNDFAHIPYLDEGDLNNLVSFLKTLSYEPQIVDNPIHE